MTTNTKFPARLVAAAVAILILGACGSSTTAPDRPRNLPLPTAASALHDDSPPITPCRSGWILMDGKWTCADPG
jgi:hypothetical protein